MRYNRYSPAGIQEAREAIAAQSLERCVDLYYADRALLTRQQDLKLQSLLVEQIVSVDPQKVLHALRAKHGDEFLPNYLERKDPLYASLPYGLQIVSTETIMAHFQAAADNLSNHAAAKHEVMAFSNLFAATFRELGSHGVRKNRAALLEVIRQIAPHIANYADDCMQAYGKALRPYAKLHGKFVGAFGSNDLAVRIKAVRALGYGSN